MMFTLRCLSADWPGGIVLKSMHCYQSFINLYTRVAGIMDRVSTFVVWRTVLHCEITPGQSQRVSGNLLSNPTAQFADPSGGSDMRSLLPSSSAEPLRHDHPSRRELV